MDGDEDALAAIRRLFADGEPRTATEVATAVGVDERTAHGALADLVGVGELERKSVDGTAVWYPASAPATDVGNGHDGGASDPGETAGFELRGAGEVIRGEGRGVDGGLATPVDRDLEASVAELSVPGASEMMRSWRRDALLAAAEHLADRGSARSTGIVESVYPGHRAGYESREAWWEFVADRLAELPGVDRDGDHWQYRG